MNAILQCLSNTRELRDYCLQRLYLRDLGHSSHAHTALMEGEPARTARSPWTPFCSTVATLGVVFSVLFFLF